MNNIAPHLLQRLTSLSTVATKPARARLQRTPHMLALEQRFMFDGAAAGDAAHAHAAADAAALARIADVPPAVQVRAADPSKTDQKKEVAIIDTSVADYKTLEAGIHDGVGIIEIDGSKDGLAQIAKWAETQSGYDAIYILSHGADGQLHLGSTTLTDSSLSDSQVQAELAELGHALNAGGDVLLYGCDIAADHDGTTFVNDFAQATGADVAASTDLTGAASLSGNWTLEYHTGTIGAPSLDIGDYQHLLSNATFDFGYHDGGTVDGSGTQSVTDTIGSDTLVVTASSASMTVFSQSDLISPASTDIPDGNAKILATGNGGVDNETQLTLSVSGSKTFDLSSLILLDLDGVGTSVTLTTSKGSEVFTLIRNNSIKIDSSNITDPSFFVGVSSITITASTDNGALFFFALDSISLTNITAPPPPAPPTTTVATAALSNDSAPNTTANNTDFITNVAAQTITGTLSANLAAGESVQVSYDGGVTWDPTSATIAVGSNAWSITTTLAGSNTFEARVTNSSGSSTAYTHSYTLDTTAPAITVSQVALSTDSAPNNAHNTDFITNVAAQTISATLSSAPAGGDIVYGSLDGGTSWTDITSKVSGTTLTWNGVTLLGSNTLKIKVTDTAGNDGVILSQAYVLDTTAPTTTINGAALSLDTGTSSSDFITNTAAQTISGSLSATLAIGDTVYVSLDNGVNWVAANTTGTNWSLAGQTLTGSNTLKIKVTDAAGNDGVSFSQAYVLETTSLAPGIPLLASASDSGTSNSDRITNVSTPTFTGSAEIGSTVKLFEGTTFIGTAVAGINGWSITSASLSDGSHTITAIATDAAGNVSTVSGALTILVDTIAPTITSVAVPSNGTYVSGNPLDFTVNFNEAVTVDITGGTPSIAVVVGTDTRSAVYVSGSGTSALVFRYVVPGGDADTDGITVGALSANSGSIKDTAGNNATLTLNSVGSTTGVNVDGSQPSVTGVSASTANGAYRSGQTVTITVDFSTAVTVNTIGGIPTLTLDSGGTATYSSGSGSNTLSFTYTVGAGQNSADLNYSSTTALVLHGATITDAGGSHQAAALTLAAPGAAGSLGANKAIVVDTTAPTIIVGNVALSADTGASSTDFITDTAAQTITATLSSAPAGGDIVQGSLDGGLHWTDITSKVSGTTLTWNGVTLLSGSNTLLLKVQDSAGNNGAVASNAYTLAVAAPPVITPPEITPPVVTPPENTPPVIAQLPTIPPPVTAFDSPSALTPVTAPVNIVAANPSDYSVPQIFLPVDSLLGIPQLLTMADASSAALRTSLLDNSAGERSSQLTTPSSPGSYRVVVLDAGASSGDALLINAPLGDAVLTAGQRLSFQVPADAFGHTNPNAVVVLSATTADGRPLPNWLTFSAKTGTFTGQVPQGMAGEISIRVVARDNKGHEAVQILKIKVGAGAGQRAQSALQQSLPGERIASENQVVAAGRSGLSEQLHAASNGGADRLGALARSVKMALTGHA